MTAGTLTPASVDARITGNVSGQVAVGNHIVQNNVDHGGIVYMAAPGQVPTPRRRPLPVFLRGRRPRSLLGREVELAAVGRALEGGVPAELHGPEGIGKTSLVKLLCHQAPPAASAGVVYYGALGEPVEDTLQFLYEAFYETDVPFKPTDAQIRHALGDLEALIVLDDLDVGRGGLDTLLDALPSATFLVASPRRALWGDGHVLELEGLPADAAVALLEREIGRELDIGEREAAQAIAAATKGEPLRLLQVAALVAELGEELTPLADRLAAGSAPEDLAALVVEALDDDQRAIFELLTVLGGPSLPPEHLAELTGVENVTPVVESLMRLGLVKAHSPRYSVTDATTLSRFADPTAWDEALRSHFATWVERNRADPRAVLEEHQALLAVLARAADDRAWSDLVRLGRAVEGPLLLTGRWGAWSQVANRELIAARRLGDRAAEAWSLHQLGTRALCVGEHGAARSQLAQALRIREDLGDHAGAAASRHNLDLLPTPPGRRGGEEVAAPPAAAPVATLPWLVGGTGLLWTPLVIIVGVVATVAATLGLVTVADRNGDRAEQTFTPAGSSISVSPTSVDFGRQSPGTVGDARTVTVTNGLTEAVRIDSVGLTGASEAFEINEDTCTGASVEPRGACTVAVAFRPPREGSFQAALAVTPRDHNQLSVALSGVGSTGVEAQSRLVFEPATVDFGTQPVGGAPATREVAVVNRGEAAGRVGVLEISGLDAGDFSIPVDGCGGTELAADGRCSVTIAFTAGRAGPRRGILNAVGVAETAALAGVGGDQTPCRFEPVADQTFAYGSSVRIPLRVTGATTDLALSTAGSLPNGLVLEDGGGGSGAITGVLDTVESAPVRVLAGGAACSESFALTVIPADVAITWLQPLVDVTLGTPAVAHAIVSQVAGTQGNLENATVTFDLTNVLTGAVIPYPAERVLPDGRVSLEILPGLPLGAYTARARLVPGSPYFRLVSPEPVAVVVNTDVLGATVYTLSDLLAPTSL
jgi:Abnormal spindle-like microcephaly-assoc'd, ASPM-SPD-2-Hydin